MDATAGSSDSHAWEAYQQISREARVMCRLNHENILGLMGIVVAPLMLLLELAPLGDLKDCIQKFQKVDVMLNANTVCSTIEQVMLILN